MRSLTINEINKKAKEIHGDFYTVVNKFKGEDKKYYLEINCPLHGNFILEQSKFLSGRGCQKCGKIRQQKHNNDLKSQCNEDFKIKAEKIHGKTYEYLSEYINAHEKMKMRCTICGCEFWQSPNKHLQGRGCPNCAVEKRASKRRKPADEFIAESKKIYGEDTYIYTKLNYKNLDTEVCLICPIHGEFLVKPSSHLYKHTCCPYCSMSSFEQDILKCLKENGILFNEQQMFDWLKYESGLKLDFYLPDYNIAIECQGQQHFRSVDLFGGEKEFNKTQNRDKEKLRLCKEHGIKLLYYTNLKEYDTFLDEKIYHSADELLEEIKPNN